MLENAKYNYTDNRDIIKMDLQPLHFLDDGSIGYGYTRNVAGYSTLYVTKISSDPHNIKNKDIKKMSTNDICIPKDGNWTLLHHAVYHNQIGQVIAILDKVKYKDLIVQTEFGDTPLHFAVRKDHKEIVAMLTKKLKPNDRLTKNALGETPYSLAKTDEMLMLIQPPIAKSAHY